MVKIAYGKSARWYTSHCCICDKELKKNENRIKGTATLLNDTVIPVTFCMNCATPAYYQQIAENFKNGVIIDDPRNEKISE